MPPALPLRSRGTAFIISRLLGEAKMPKPAPHSTSRHMMLAAEGSGGSRAVRTSPAVMLVSPIAPSTPAWWRSARRPAIGAMVASANGQAVSRMPVLVASRPSTV